MIKLVNFIFELFYTVFAEIITALSDVIPDLIQPARKTEFDAQFIPASKILKTYGTGITVNGKYTLGLEAFRHVLVAGNSGAGKTSCVIIPSILSIAKSGAAIVVNDPSKELMMLTAGALHHRFSYKNIVVDFSDKRSCYYNPLKRATTVSEIKQLSEIIIKSSLGDKGEIYWSKAAEDLTTMFARYLIFHAAPEYRNFYNVLHLIKIFAANPERLDLIFIQTNNADLIAEYKSFVAIGDRTLSSIVSTAKTALSIFSDDTIATITSGEDEIDFEAFRTQRLSLFINTSVPLKDYTSVLSSLLFTQFFNHILKQVPSKDKQNPIYFLLDETAALTIPLSMILNYGRKYFISCITVVQELEQLDFKFGKHEAQNIITNSNTKIFLPGQSHKTCTFLQDSLGKYEFRDEQSNGALRVRPLLTSEEIRMTDRALIFVGSNFPLHEKLFPYYKNSKFKSLTEIPPVELTNEISFTAPPLIELPNA